MAADPGSSRRSGKLVDAAFGDRLRAIEDELRTPLTLLAAALDELAGTVVDVEGRAAVERARRSAAQMRAIGERVSSGNDVQPPSAPIGEVAAKTNASAKLSVLIADDNADLRAYLATMLAGKYAVDTVSDGAALYAAARRHVPDVIVSDARMPFIDGFEAARLLREDPLTANIPIVLLSGNAGTETAAAARDAGIDDYLIKPFTIAEFTARVDALARTRSAFVETADAPSGADLRTWRLLAAASERFVGIMKPGRALDALGDLIVPAIGDWCMAFLREGDSIKLKSVVHRQPSKRDFAWMLEREYPTVTGGGSPLDRAIITGEPTYIPEVTPEIIATMACDAHHAAVLTALQFRSVAIVPFLVNGACIGAIVVLGAETKALIAPADVDVLPRLVARAAAAYHAATRNALDANVASGLQRALLPGSLPAVEGLALSVAYAPAAGDAHAGGGWYDAMMLADGRVLLTIGDVAGNGIAASVAMSELRIAMRRFARDDPRPSAILARANAMLAFDGRVATALVAVLEPLALDLTIASAGPIAPAILDPHGVVKHLMLEGLALGTDRATTYAECDLRLEPGSSILLYSDGSTAVADADAAALRTRLECALRTTSSASDDLAGSVYRDFFDDDAPANDVSLLAVTTSATLERLDLTLPAEPSNAGRARTAIARFLHGAGMSDRAGDLLVAAGEAIGNAIEHAYRGASGALRVRGRVLGDDVTVEIRDFGQWHSDTASEGRGFGLPLMRAFADGVEVERTPFGTRIELLARHAPASGSHGQTAVLDVEEVT